VVSLEAVKIAVAKVLNGIIQVIKQMQAPFLTQRETEALKHIRNALLHEGYSPSMRDLCRMMGYRSPRSALLILNSLIQKGVLVRRSDGSLQLKRDLPESRANARTVEVPLVGAVACGTPMMAQENIEAFIPVSVNLARPGAKYFLLRAKGDSMDQAGILDGNLLLVRQQSSAENGDKVVALIDDEATVKELRHEREVVILKPRSKNLVHKPIILTQDFVIQGVVVSVLPTKID
jgi:repressor LexA